MTQNTMKVFEFKGLPLHAIHANKGLILPEGEWFRAGDVCRMLGIKNVGDALERIKPSWKQLVPRINIGTTDVNTRGNPNVWLINEAALYKLTFTSRKPEAEDFTDWVAGEVLPTLRKTGGRYETPTYRVRMLANVQAIPRGHFSVLWELYSLLIWKLESQGHTLPETMLPDSQVGKQFCNYLREQYREDPETFPTYRHVYPDGRVCFPKAYPNKLLPAFREFMQLWEKFRLVDYFKEKDPIAIKLLKED